MKRISLAPIAVLLALFLVFPVTPDSGGQSAAQPALASAAGDQTLTDVATRAVQSVVNVSSTYMPRGGSSDSPSPRRFGPGARPQPMRGLGSGVIVSNDGLVITNNHVVQDATQLTVKVPDGREFQVDVLGTDPLSDLAVLRLKGDFSGLQPLPFGTSADLKLGEIVLAVGNPFGLSNTVTMGIISALGRANVGIADYEDFIQTDAAINPGNSGGALMNMRGEVIGINTAIASETGGYEGIGFAIPSDMVKVVMQSLVSTGKVVRGYLGVGIQPITPALAQALNLATSQGALVSSVEPDSPAAKAGMQRYDVITAVNGQPVTTAAELRNTIAMMGPGKQAQLRILRNGKEQNVTVTLGTLPTPKAAEQAAPPSAAAPEQVGVSLVEINDNTRRQYNLPSDVKNGLLVVNVLPGSRAEDAGIAPGDVILEVNRKAVNTVSDFRSQYQGAKGQVLVLIRRETGTFLTVIQK